MANLRVDKITSTETFETTGSVQFDGTDDELNFTSIDVGTGDFTYEAWVYPTVATVDTPIIVWHNGTSKVHTFGIWNGSAIDAIFSANARPGANNSWIVSSAISVNTWHHIAFVRASGTLKIYVDGTEQSTSAGSGSAGGDPSSHSTDVSYIGSSAINENFVGHISNARAIKGKALYTENFKPPMRELEVTPETVLLACQHKTDASHEKTGKTITVNGNAVANELTPGLLTDVVKSGGSRVITGSVDFGSPLENKYLSLVSDSEFTAAGDFTIEAWINLGINTDISPIFNIGNYAASSGLQFYVTTGGLLASYANNALQHQGGVVSVNSWNHVALVRNGGTISQYLNGVKTGSYSYSSTLSGLIYIGADNYGVTITHYSNGFTSNLRYVVGTALYTDNFIPPTRELKKVPGTVLLCCQDKNSVTTEATGKTITSNGNPAASNFTPQVGNDGSVEFVGPTKINTENYFYLPTGDTESRGSYNAGTRGLNGGGYGNSPLTNLNIIDYITIATTSNAQDFGDLITKRHVLTACSSSTRGVFGGGRNPALLNVMDYVTIASTGDAQDFGDLSQARSSNGACSSSTRGVFGGGIRLVSPMTNSNVIDYITISTLGDAQDFGDLIEERRGTVSCSSPTRGVWGGNITPSLTNTLEYITISSTGDAQDFGDLIQAIAYPGFCSSSTRGVLGGAYSPALSNTISFITISTTGNAQDFGDLTQARGYVSGACSSSIRGVWMGGYTTTVVNTIDYVTISSTGNAVDFGDVTEDTNGNAACSNGHGGLG